jgi:YidC/Oxa1 family membrane protein insertase
LSKIQQKYEGRTDDAARMQQAQEMQALYNKHGINPMGSMLMPLLQFPILIAMYYASQRADVVVNGTIFGVALKTKPIDAFKSLGTLWPIALVFVIMAVLQAMSMLLPQHLAEQRKKKDRSYKAYDDKGASDQQKSQKYMMYGMLLLVIVLGLRWPAAMSVYWSVSSLANILKTLYIQKRYIDNDAKL